MASWKIRAWTEKNHDAYKTTQPLPKLRCPPRTFPLSHSTLAEPSKVAAISPSMFKSALRATPRRIASSRTALTRSSARRLLSTAPPSQKSRSWKSSAVRWGLAGAGVYYYNTSNVFAEEPEGRLTTVRSCAEANANRRYSCYPEA